MPYATNPDGTRIYYEVRGEGPAVTFIHGSGGHHAAWWQQVPHFRRDFTVVTLDLRGFGRSDSGMDEFDSLEFPGDILAVLDDAGIDRTVFVGQSIGAAAGFRAALANPERAAGVVLAHSLGGIDDPELKELVAADRAQAEKLPTIDRLMSRSFQESEPELTFLFKQMGTFNKAKMADLRNLTSGGATIDEIRTAGFKLCFLAGEQDAVLRPDTVRKAHELLPDSELEIVPEGPHSMYWERPDLFNAALERLLRSIYELAPA